MDIKEQDILGDSIHEHWYYVSKGRAMRQLLGGIRVPEVLDIGAGSGVFSRQLLGRGVAERAVCLDSNYSEGRQEIDGGRPISFVRTLGGRIPQQLVLMMDVLEHVDDDAALLRQYAPGPGGHVLITVPAFRFLWSGHDVFLEHRRRYTARTLEETVRAAGLEVVRMRYFFGLLFPAVAALRLLKRAQRTEARSELAVYPRILNRALIGIHDFERRILFPFNTLAGLSIFCLCRSR